VMSFYTESATGGGYNGSSFSLKLDYVTLSFACKKGAIDSYKMQTSFVNSWEQRSTWKIVAIELDERWRNIFLDDHSAVLKEVQSIERGKGLLHEYSLKCRERLADALSSDSKKTAETGELAVAYAQHAACLRLWKHGWDHPKTATALLLLFECIYRREEDSRDLRPLLILTTDIFQKYFFNGLHNNARERCLFLRGAAALAQDDYALAASGYETLLLLRELQLGFSHLDTTRIRLILGSVYGLCGHWEDARASYKAAFEILKDIVGEDNPETLAAKKGLAQSYLENEDYMEAERLLRSLPESLDDDTQGTQSTDKKTLLRKVYLGLQTEPSQ